MKSKLWWVSVFCGAWLALGFVSVAHAADTPSAGMTRQQKDAACTRCHDETDESESYILSIYQTRHGAMGDSRTPACQDCHGSSEKHLAGNLDGKGRPQPDRIFGSKRTIAGYEPSSAQEQSEACLSCHKSGLRQHWPGSQHQTSDVACSSCHVVHNPVDPVRVKATQPEVCFACHKDQRALIKKISAHPIGVGKMACSDCHNPHGTASEHLLKQNTVNETCFLCHADKRGPFLWEHQPVTENCANCHNPHGSNITPLLKSRAPFLCAECHDGPHNSQAPYGPIAAGTQGGAIGTAAPSQMATGRACMNCHVMVHGSNSPSGAFLHR
jgi:DmsE family decaheme c-type cytochrome